MTELRIIIILPILFITAASFAPKDKDNYHQTCRTRECFQIAETFEETMNKSVDPCENFYEYACGGWKATNPIPPYESARSRFLIFRAAVEDGIKDELESKITAEDILPIRQAKKWFHSCMDTRARESRGIKPIDAIMMQIGGWPLIMDTQEWDDEITWQQVDEYYSRLMGDYALYQMRLIAPLEERSYPNGVVVLMSSELPLHDVLPSNYRNYTSHNVTLYKLLMKDVARLFIEHNKANVSDDQLERDIDDVIKLEKNVYLSSNYQDSMKIEVKTVDEPEESDLNNFIKWWDNYTEPLKNNSKANNSEFDWRSVIQLLFTKTGIKRNDSISVFTNDPKYFYFLSTVLQSTDTRTIVNYIHWRFVSQMLKYTTDEMKDKFFEIVKNEYGTRERPPRWRECVREMEMKDAMALIFIEKYFNDSRVKAVKKMTQNIKSEMGRQMQNSNWMSPAAKVAAQKKLDEMRTLLGFPDWYKNRTAVINYYKGLTIGYDYLDNVLSFMRYKKKMEVRKLVGRGGDDEWQIDPTDIDGLYIWKHNILNVPVGDFQPPLFDLHVPNYVNYGTTGVIVAHEIAHGFDPQGVHYAANSSQHLFEEDMMNMYFRRVKCFIDKFNHYDNDTLNLGVGRSREQSETVDESEEFDTELVNEFKGSNGTRTASENVADATGTQAVLAAYKRVRRDGEFSGEMKLPGFEEFTDEQMFFISFAEIWCQVLTPEYEQRKSKIRDNHSPPHLRVIGSLSNTPEFGRAFNCPRDSPMNPKKKCNIWTMPTAKVKSKSSGAS